MKSVAFCSYGPMVSPMPGYHHHIAHQMYVWMYVMPCHPCLLLLDTHIHTHAYTPLLQPLALCLSRCSFLFSTPFSHFTWFLLFCSLSLFLLPSFFVSHFHFTSLHFTHSLPSLPIPSYLSSLPHSTTLTTTTTAHNLPYYTLVPLHIH